VGNYFSGIHQASKKCVESLDGELQLERKSRTEKSVINGKRGKHKRMTVVIVRWIAGPSGTVDAFAARQKDI
jgi:hypothetical protein